MRHYKLNEQGEPVACSLAEVMASGFPENGVVKREKLFNCSVSTVFLVFDHSQDDSGPPILWETMVFGGKLNGYQTRCSGSREQAEAMHQSIINKVKQAYDTRTKE